jgi:hypothetical protein
MAVAQCSCGKRTGVSDSLVGQSIRCPACGEQVGVMAASRPQGQAAANKPKVSLQMSSGTMGMIAVVVLAFGAAFFIKLVPGRAMSQWKEINTRADGEVTDVISFALQAYSSQQDLGGSSKEHYFPKVERPINFDVPSIVMRVPEEVNFNGMTEQGRFAGTYNTQTGEITADIAFGGRTVSGLIVAAKETGAFHITGREKDGTPTAEMDGTPLRVIYPAKDAQ